MKIIIAAAFVLVAIAPAIADDMVCLNVADIAGSQSNKDGTAIIFKMRDGKAWRGDLKGQCPDLAFDGFSWVMRGPDEVCENIQRIKVLHSGEICQLGKFTPLTGAQRN